jgi:5'-phosphate synthase pdxT subunit
MDIRVNRNAFGRQLDSFEADIPLQGIAGEPFHAVFIRAPIVTHVEDSVDVIGRLPDERVVAVQQDHLLATAFHPELTDDLRLHEYFVNLVKAKGNA